MDSPFIAFANNLSPLNALKSEQDSFSIRCARRSLRPAFATMNVHGANSLSRVPLSDVTNLEVSWDTDLINSSNCTTPIKENPRVGGLLDESTSILTQKPSVFTPPPFFNSSNEYRILDHNSAHTTATDGTLKVYPTFHPHSATTGAFVTPVLDASDQIPCGDKESQKQLSILDDTKLRRSKAKRKMSENGCRGCNCKKSQCLKLYCECFAAGVYCTESCTCNCCSNTSIHEATVVGKRKEIELRSPLAFAPKVIRPPEQISGGTGGDATKTPAARHKHGCNCRRSGCLKGYCDCFKAGVGCSPDCRCEGCRNKYGRRDEPDGNSCRTDGEGQDSWPNGRSFGATPSNMQALSMNLMNPTSSLVQLGCGQNLPK